MSQHAENTTSAAPRLDSGAAALWASALVIAALIITQAGRLSAGNAALADVAITDDLSVATVFANNGEDVVTIIDRQAERLFVYGVEQGSRVELLQSHDLRELFGQGRGAAPKTTAR